MATEKEKDIRLELTITGLNLQQMEAIHKLVVDIIAAFGGHVAGGFGYVDEQAEEEDDQAQTA